MAKGMSFKVLLELQTKEFQKGIRSIQRQLDGFAKYIKSAFALGSVTMFGRQMVQVGKDFENAMARVQAVSNATQEEFKKMQAEAQRLGSTTRYTATEAANALENLTRNGMSAANATKALSSVLQLAQANSIGLADAANIITNSLNMFNLGVEQTSRVNDVLSATASHAATDITSLYEAMTNAAPAANVLGFSIEEVSSAIGALAQRGVKGAEAGTKLRIAFQKMADPKVIAKMKEQGIEIDETTMKSEGLLKTVQKLAKANLSLGQLGQIFDAKSAMAVQQLVASLDDLEGMLDVTANAAGETARMFNQSVGSVQGELDSLKSMYEGLLISMSQKTSGAVKGVVRLLQNLIVNFESVGGTIMNIASVAVPLFIGKVIQLGTAIKAAMQSAAAGMATLKASMGGIISLVATLVTWVGTALVGAWNRANKEMKDAKKQMEESEVSSRRMQMAVDGIIKKIGDGSDKGTLNSAVKEATRLFPEFAEAINNARKIAEKTEEWDRLKRVLQDIADLQSLVTTREAQERLYNAQVNKVGDEMWGSTKSRGEWEFGAKRKMDKAIGYDSNNFGHAFKKHLEKAFDKDTARDIFKDIAKAFVDAYNEPVDIEGRQVFINGKEITDPKQLEDALKTTNADNAARRMIESYGFNLDNEYGDLAARWLAQFRPQYGDTIGGRMGDANKTARDIAKTDSTILANRFKIIEDSVNNGLESITGSTRADNEQRYKLAKDFYDSVLDLGFSDKSEEFQKAAGLLNQYAKYAPKTNPGGGGGGGGSSTSKAKTDADYVKDAIDDYNEAKTKLDNRLAAGTIATEEYNRELDNLEDKTWETITAFSNFESILEKLGQTAAGSDLKNRYGENRASERHEELFSAYGNLAKYLPQTAPAKEDKTGNVTQEVVDVNFDYRDSLNQMVSDLEAAIENGDFDIVKGDAIEMLEKLKTAAKDASEQAEDLQAKLTLNEAIVKLDEQIQSLSQSSWETFHTMADAMDRVNSSLISIAEVFNEDLRDSPFYKAWQGLNSVLNNTIQIMEAVMTAIQLVNQLDRKSALEKVKNSAMEVAANKAAAKSEMEKAAAQAGAAAAGGASAVASIPYVGPALAIAAVASITAAILASMSKFEKGGIVGGSSYSGDHNVVRANSGEMILTKAQQKTLFDIANGKGAGGGQVEFKLRGTDLIGAIKNTESRMRG